MLGRTRKLTVVVTFILMFIFFLWSNIGGNLKISSAYSRPTAILQFFSTVPSQNDLMKQRRLYLGKPVGNNSYRAHAEIKEGRIMELKKVTDDYSYCPRIYPFLDPHPYIENSKNPCWYEDGQLQCIPYFYVAGFSKCGTTDLYFKISRHHEVFSAGSKEQHWFDYKRFTDNNRFINNYTSYYREPTNRVKFDLQKEGRSNFIAGDGTPCYAWGSLNWPCYEGNEREMTEPLYTNADIIYRLNPKARIIMLVREPVKRLRSRMLTYVSGELHPAYHHPTSETFYNHVADGIAKYKECFQQWTHRACAYNGTLFAQVKLRLAEGMYSIYLQDWVKVFPKDQILILRFEDYIANAAKVLKEVYSFLDLAPLGDDELKSIANLKAQNTGRHYDIDVWTNKTTEILEDFYRPFSRDLAELLGDQKFAWHY